MKQYYKDNEERKKQYSKLYYINNMEKIRRCSKMYSDKHKQQRNNSIKQRRKIDLKFNVNCRLTNAMTKALKGNKGGRHWESLVSYNLNDLIERLKFTMPEGYSWQDYLEGKLHIDHIIPREVFNYTTPEHVDFKRCWALSNLQLLPAKENREKSNKLIKPFQLALQLC